MSDPRKSYRFSDNVNVLSNRDGAEYLSIYLADERDWTSVDPKMGKDPRAVVLSRYGVPGRCNVYRFGMSCDERRRRFTFGTEYGLTVGAAAAKCARDLSKPYVVKLFTNAFGAPDEVNYRFLDEMCAIISNIAPESKTMKALDAIRDTIHKRRSKRWDERKKVRDLLVGAGLPVPKELTHCRP